MHAKLTTITINGQPVTTRICDTQKQRRHGLAGATGQSQCACVMIWHSTRTTITLGAQHLHQTYYVFTLATTQHTARSYQNVPYSLLPKKTLTIYPSGKRPALIEIPATIAQKIMQQRNTYGHPTPPKYGQIWYPNQTILLAHLPPVWQGASIKWNIPHRDTNTRQTTTKTQKPTDPQ